MALKKFKDDDGCVFEAGEIVGIMHKGGGATLSIKGGGEIKVDNDYMRYSNPGVGKWYTRNEGEGVEGCLATEPLKPVEAAVEPEEEAGPETDPTSPESSGDGSGNDSVKDETPSGSVVEKSAQESSGA